MRLPRAVRGSLVALLGLALATTPAAEAAAPSSGVDPARIPATARRFLPLVTELTARHCPELAPLWVVAQVAAESGWEPTAAGAGSRAHAGLLQFDEPTWVAAGGEPWPSARAGSGRPVTDPETHLRVAVPWLCTTLRAVAAHLTSTRKSASVLDAMLVCHVAGCSRVTRSATGVPRAGEAGCDARCAELVARYLDAVHGYARQYAAAVPPTRTAPTSGPTAPATASPPSATPTAPSSTTAAPVRPSPTGSAGPRPPSRAREPSRPPAPAGLLDPSAWTGGSTGCTLPDPTGGRCVTGATRHGLDAAGTTFDGWENGPAIRSAGCWDRHAWNPRSDHPQGRACDLFAAAPGRFARGDELADGWRVAQWFRGHAGPLQVKYVIWQGRYWDPRVRDQDGWGRRYSGAGVYDVRNATGGHYDHVHVSFRE